MIPQRFTTQNRCYQTSGTIVPKGIMLHSVGCAQPDPEVFIRNWNNTSCDIGVHAICGPHEGYQLLPWNKRGWHAGAAYKGGPSANDTHIGIEMTEPSTIKYTGGASFIDLSPLDTCDHVRYCYNQAVKMCAELCTMFGFNPLTDIISHAEGHAMGIASNHGDPTHLWKKCTSLGFTMDGFRKDVQKYMDATVVNAKPSSWAEDDCEWAKSLGIFAGDEKGNMHWHEPITREEVAVVLHRLYVIVREQGRG